MIAGFFEAKKYVPIGYKQLLWTTLSQVTVAFNLRLEFFLLSFLFFFWDEALSDVDLNKNITDQVSLLKEKKKGQFSIGFDSVVEMRLVWLYLDRSRVSYFLCRYCDFRFVAIGYLALCTVR